ncbi:MAG: type II toxin-antitoxin system VapC family toxin [Candidatus Woesebacteria bacterium]|nr:type II toxin-antitoxin system VapC family toxin [Candidatus Woesebacteria bacterium]
MVCYVDTSVLVALCVNEPKSEDVSRWYAKCKDKLVSSVWCVTEFASALGIKQRTGQITTEEAQIAWHNFQRLCANDLTLLSPDADIFHKAAFLTLDAATGLRAGDALHLTSALQANVKRMATLDDVFARNAKQRKIAVVVF